MVVIEIARPMKLD